jgi:ankyrin repeat protein
MLSIQNGVTGLMWASSDGFTETVSVLLAAKADPNITDEVKLHYSHCLYNSNLMHYVIEW